MSDVHDQNDASIPLLSDVLVPGNTLLGRGGAGAPEADVAGADADVAQGLGDPDAAAALRAGGLSESDADALVERLEGRCLSWLTGDGRRVIEARCNTALLEHAHWVVGQVSREIGLALETELKDWVRAAVREELGARGIPAGGIPARGPQAPSSAI